MDKQHSFGIFFRAARVGLGIKLREFARLHGFDAGNISRLELGKVSPPKSMDTLAIYAAALGLQPGTHDYNTFFELAAFETDRVPPQVRDNSDVRNKLPRLYRALRPEQRRLHPWTTAYDLEQWSGTLDARAQLPRLIRRLIRDTAKGLQRCTFAAGEGSQRKGYDGIVATTAFTEHVPCGQSVWETGVDRNAKKKATDDYNTRTTSPGVADRGDTVYIAVTSRRFAGKEEWAQERRNQSLWKDVLAYDCDDLESWLEIAPRSTDLWVAGLLGKPIDGIQEPSQHWANLSAIAEKPLNPSLFLTSRQVDIDQLETFLNSPPSVLKIVASALEDVVDFVAAYFEDFQAKQVTDLISQRALIVGTSAAWEVLSTEQSPLLLIARPELQLDSHMTSQAIRNGHHVLLPTVRRDRDYSPQIILSRPQIYELEKALTACDLTSDKIRQAVRDCSGSLTVLKRRLTRVAATIEPEWARDNRSELLAVLMLFGSWEETSTADCEIIEAFTGHSYSSLASLLQSWTNVSDAPLLKLSHAWSFTSREDAWKLLNRYLSVVKIREWQPIAVQILTADHPRFELEPDERRHSFLRTSRPKYSQSLRRGVSNTLALLATHPPLESEHHIVQAVIDRTISNILPQEAGWIRWASLGDCLPLLAEASPDSFLSIVERDLLSGLSSTANLLSESTDGLFGDCLQAGLLWALEALAWDPSSLSRVTLILSFLTRHEKSHGWANKPSQSLHEILLPWLPHTTANVELRTKALKKLSKDNPEFSFDFLLKLLPTTYGVSSPTYQPTWRPWATFHSRSVSNFDYAKQIDSCTEIVLELADSDVSRLTTILEHSQGIPQRFRIQLVERISAVSKTNIDHTAYQKLIACIRSQLSYLPEDAAVSGNLNTQWVDLLRGLLSELESGSPTLRHSWLFAHWPHFIDEPEIECSKRAERIETERTRALAEILNVGEFSNVILLANNCEDPRAVGATLATFGEYESHIDRTLLPDYLTGHDHKIVNFIRGYLSARFEQQGWDWADSLPLSQWNAEQVANFAICLPVEKRTWSLLATFGDQALRTYWENIYIFSIRNTSDIPHAVSELLRYKRPLTAVDVLASTLYEKQAVAPELIVRVLQANLECGDERPWQHSHHHLQQLFLHLQSDQVSLDPNVLSSLEWSYVALLDGHGGKPTALHGRIISDPHFFSKLIQFMFRSTKQEEKDFAEPTEEQKRKATAAFSLLYSLRSIPGAADKSNVVDTAELNSWVSLARQDCETSGHLGICDDQIGRLLAYAPGETDGSWPCIAVRDLLENLNSQELIHAFVVGVLNRRGIVSKSLFDGGAQERELSNQYKNLASLVDGSWPRVAHALRQIAQSYEADAVREDQEAEANRIGKPHF